MTSFKNDRKDTRAKIKAQFGKFKDSDINQLKSYIEKLSSKEKKANALKRTPGVTHSPS